MKIRIRSVFVLAFAVSSACFGLGCGNSNDGGVNATQSIKDANGPKSQEEYARQQLAKNAAAKKAARPTR